MLLGRYLRSALVIADFVAFATAYLLAWSLFDAPAAAEWFGLRVFLPAVVAFFIPETVSASTNRLRAAKMEGLMRYALHDVVLHAMIFIVLLYLTRQTAVTIEELVAFYSLYIVLLPAVRIACRMVVKRLRAAGRNKSRVVIVGANEAAARLCQEFAGDPGFGYCMMGVFAPYPGPSIDPRLYRGELADLDSFIKENNIDEIYCTLSADNAEDMHAAVAAADSNMIRYYYVPQVPASASLRGYDVVEIGHVAVLAENKAPLSRAVNRMLKRVLDILVAAVAIVMFPLFLIPIAIAIKLDSPGPVFYRQRRTGLEGREFDCLKFRTMQYEPADDSPAAKNDPRVTRVGRFLRCSSLDELPQIFNVLLGDMSIVGPRPHMTSHTEYYSKIVDRYMMRHAVKPGITGWAQINGLRGSTDELWKMERRVEHDVWYIEHWSLLLDLKIIARTIFNILRGDDNAY